MLRFIHNDRIAKLPMSTGCGSEWASPAHFC